MSVLSLPTNREPAVYARHALHGDGRIWAETNCYVDLWIELLSAWGFEPHAALPFTLGIDFEGDQWTFFKFPLEDLDRLYGLDVQELALWRPLGLHVAEQVRHGRPVLVEVDSFYLPDTAGTAYRHTHVKTTVAMTTLEPERRRLGYFHNAGFFHLEGDDFTGIFEANTGLPPYAEFVKRRPLTPLQGDDLTHASLGLLRKHLGKRPAANPFPAFKARFADDLATLAGQSMEYFHAYAFATLRQFGAAFELAGSYLSWLEPRLVDTPLTEASTALTNIAAGAKALQFRLARAMNGKKPLDLTSLDTMADAWQRTLDFLGDTFAEA